MKVIEKFNLIKEIPNYLNLSSSVIDQYAIDNGVRRLFVYLFPHRDRVNHFTRDFVYDLISNKSRRKILKIVRMERYPLPVTYNKKTKEILINISAMGAKDLERVDFKTLYAAICYGMCFGSFFSKMDLDISYSRSVGNFMTSILIRIFGKMFGLLGSYTSRVIAFRFLVHFYVLMSFFSELVSMDKAIHLASSYSSFDGSYLRDKLQKYDFSNIKNFILALNELEIMPGINDTLFVNKIYTKFGYSFIPGLEDCARFFSIILASDLRSNLVPGFLRKYNETEMKIILEICEKIFRRVY